MSYVRCMCVAHITGMVHGAWCMSHVRCMSPVWCMVHVFCMLHVASIFRVTCMPQCCMDVASRMCVACCTFFVFYTLYFMVCIFHVAFMFFVVYVSNLCSLHSTRCIDVFCIPSACCIYVFFVPHMPPHRFTRCLPDL